ncbi:MAG: hypothetical protein ACOCXT_03045 [Candidatus Dojkabacteria bacterium]
MEEGTISARSLDTICDIYAEGDNVELYYTPWQGTLYNRPPSLVWRYFIAPVLIGIVSLPFFLIGLIFPLSVIGFSVRFIKSKF